MNLLGPNLMNIFRLHWTQFVVGRKTSNNILRFHGKKVHFFNGIFSRISISHSKSFTVLIYIYIYYSSVVLWSEKCCGNSGSRVIVPLRDFSVFLLTFSYLYIRRIFFVGKKKNHNSFPAKIKRIRCGNRKK